MPDVRRYVKKHKLEAATVTEKQCTKCLVVKPAQQFHAQRNVSTGLHSWCKTCVAAEYARNPRVCTPGHAVVYEIPNKRTSPG